MFNNKSVEISAFTLQHSVLAFSQGVTVIRSARSGRWTKSVNLLPAIWVLLQIVSAPLWAAETPFAATLEVDTPIASEGYFVLSWASPDNSSSTLVLQQSTTTDFRAATSTPVNASGSLTLTGFTDGLYYFRVGADGQWSAVQEVRVAHHSLSRALTWFAVGALLFLVLAAVILSAVLRSGDAAAEPRKGAIS